MMVTWRSAEDRADVFRRLRLTKTALLNQILVRLDPAYLIAVGDEIRSILAERRAAHTCHAEECEEIVPPERLMCIEHWRLVPKQIQRRVWVAYRPGQCDDQQPSREWLSSARDAIEAVARAEGRR